MATLTESARNVHFPSVKPPAASLATYGTGFPRFVCLITLPHTSGVRKPGLEFCRLLRMMEILSLTSLLDDVMGKKAEAKAESGGS